MKATTTLALFVFLNMLCLSSSAQVNLKIFIENHKLDNGNIYISVYNSEESFLKHPYKLVNIKSDKSYLLHEINLPPGKYSVAIFQDENQDRTLTLNSLGLKEAHIFSQNKTFHKDLNFHETSFEVNKGSKSLKMSLAK